MLVSETEQALAHRTQELEANHLHWIHCRTDRLFVRLLFGQWVVGILLALLISPRTWIGTTSQLHVHVWAAVLLGGLVAFFPIAMALRHPGTLLSRHTIAIGQALSSALLIHLTGGRIETHFHVFGSLALVAFYRDWKVLVTASSVIALDHLVRGIFWPQSVFGVLVSAHWRWLEHAGWVVFEDLFLLRACFQGRAEIREIAVRRAKLEATKELVEVEVCVRTAELVSTNESLELEIKERVEAEKQRDRLTAELVAAQKLESIGQLAAGIAHEINTPTQFVGDNTRFLQEAFVDLDPVLQKAALLAEAVRKGESAQDLADALLAAIETADVEYLSTEIPRAIEQSLEGVKRVAKIVGAMKEFSHPGVEGMTALDINHAIKSTVTVASSEWKYLAELVLDLAPDLPLVSCMPGEFNQVVLNMIVNAAHAIGDVVGDAGAKGLITISTRSDDGFVEIRIGDSGSGIPEEIRQRIFDPFFTTKEVGKGTGQGLSIAQNVIVKRHSGTLACESQVGAGTTFVIRLPVEQQEPEALEEAA